MTKNRGHLLLQSSGNSTPVRKSTLVFLVSFFFKYSSLLFKDLTRWPRLKQMKIFDNTLLLIRFLCQSERSGPKFALSLQQCLQVGQVCVKTKQTRLFAQIQAVLVWNLVSIFAHKLVTPKSAGTKDLFVAHSRNRKSVTCVQRQTKLVLLAKIKKGCSFP